MVGNPPAPIIPMEAIPITSIQTTLPRRFNLNIGFSQNIDESLNFIIALRLFPKKVSKPKEQLCKEIIFPTIIRGMI
jgi:hypothetical protein